MHDEWEDKRLVPVLEDQGAVDRVVATLHPANLSHPGSGDEGCRPGLGTKYRILREDDVALRRDLEEPGLMNIDRATAVDTDVDRGDVEGLQEADRAGTLFSRGLAREAASSGSALLQSEEVMTKITSRPADLDGAGHLDQPSGVWDTHRRAPAPCRDGQHRDRDSAIPSERIRICGPRKVLDIPVAKKPAARITGDLVRRHHGGMSIASAFYPRSATATGAATIIIARTAIAMRRTIRITFSFGRIKGRYSVIRSTSQCHLAACV